MKLRRPLNLSRMTPFFGIIAVLSFGPKAYPQERNWKKEPHSFLGVPFGASQNQAASKMKVLTCESAISDSKYCLFRFTLGDIQVYGKAIFLNDHVIEFSAIAPQSSFSALRDLLKDRYGSASVEGQSNLTWFGKKVTLEAEKNCPPGRRNIANDVAAFVEKKELERPTSVYWSERDAALEVTFGHGRKDLDGYTYLEDLARKKWDSERTKVLEHARQFRNAAWCYFRLALNDAELRKSQDQYRRKAARGM
jgi:hypothetical protein